MTIYDISKKAGVSIATVSRVLNGSDKVRPATRKKVMDIIEKYDYTPNAFARGMGLHSVQTIGILCADSSDLFLAKAVYLSRAGAYSPTAMNPFYAVPVTIWTSRRITLNLILSKKVDGIISRWFATSSVPMRRRTSTSRTFPHRFPLCCSTLPLTIRMCTAHSVTITHLCSRQPFPCLTSGIDGHSLSVQFQFLQRRQRSLADFRAAMEEHTLSRITRNGFSSTTGVPAADGRRRQLSGTSFQKEAYVLSRRDRHRKIPLAIGSHEIRTDVRDFAYPGRFVGNWI